jgi:hypothetical protein
MRRVWAELWAAVRLGYRSLMKMIFFPPTRRREMAMCWHHSRSTGESWIQDTLIDLGRDKMFRCSQCQEIWLLSERV